MDSINTTETVPAPVFSAEDTLILKRYFELNKRYHDKINEELTSRLQDHPLWGPLLKSIPPEQIKAQNAHSLELQRAAIYEGKWDEYSRELITQGRMYARMHVSYSDWYEIVGMYKVHIMPYIKKDFADDIDQAVTFLNGLSRFVDFAMYVIAEAYFQEKNSIIAASEERFRAIFENSADYIALIGTDGAIEMVNNTSSGIPKEDIIGRSIYEFGTEEYTAAAREAISSVFRDKAPASYDTVVSLPEGKKYFSCTVSPILGKDETVHSAVVISRDVTKQKKSEAEILELNTTLERKVQQRTEELNSINKELESFSYSVSHDLRGPLRAIHGFTQILQEETEGRMSEDAADAMNEIISNSRRMGVLIDDLLEFSRLGKQNLSKAELNMQELFNSVITDLQTQRQKLPVSYDLKELQKTHGDRGMLRQVAFNLVSNAIKYSGKKTEAKIEIGSYPQNGSTVYYVKDSGAGFDMAYYDKLFGVFQRLHRADEFEGTGVGLAIVQRIISKHSGKVWAEGKVNEGATFYFSLPNN